MPIVLAPYGALTLCTGMFGSVTTGRMPVRVSQLGDGGRTTGVFGIVRIWSRKGYQSGSAKMIPGPPGSTCSSM